MVTVLDALQIINNLFRLRGPDAESPLGEQTPTGWAAASDSVIADLDDEDDDLLRLLALDQENQRVKSN
jgi:hypothetical protein